MDATVESRSPRVLILLTEVYADGGIQRFNRTFLSACDRLGISCEVLSLGDNEQSRARWTAPRSVHIRMFSRNKLRFALTAGALLAAGGYDFVIIGHVNLLPMSAAFLTLRSRRKTRVLLVAHGVEVWTGMDGWARRRAMHAVNLTLCVSHYTRDAIRRQIPELAAERFSVFPNALSETWTERFAQVKPDAVRMPDTDRFLLSVTRLERGDRYKGIVSVIEALAMLRDSSVRYLIAGRGEDQEFLRRVAARFGVAGRVHLLGAVSDAVLVDLYRRCAAFVLPSGKEGFGIVFLEAMFFGAPVIAAREKGAVDVVSHDRSGLLVAYGDTAALREAIERVLEDGALRARLRAQGLATVTGEGAFTFPAYVVRLGQVLGLPLPGGRRTGREAPAGMAPEMAARSGAPGM